MNRREFIKHVALGTASAAVLSTANLSVFGKSATALPLPNQPSGTAGTYIVGTVVATSATSVVVSTAQAAAQSLTLPSFARVWRGGITGADSIMVGDFVRCWAIEQNGQLAIQKVWSNIVQLRGTVTSIEGSRVEITSFKDSQPRSAAITSNTGSSQLLSSVQPGAPVFIIGYLDPVSGAVAATRIDVVSLLGA